MLCAQREDACAYVTACRAALDDIQHRELLGK